jgi:NhaP-type Na+/H+ or K+/H+ antiporter
MKGSPASAAAATLVGRFLDEQSADDNYQNQQAAAAAVADDMYASSSESWEGSTEAISAYLVFFSFLLAVVLILSKYLHDRPRLGSIVPEAGMIIVVGMLAGSVVNLLQGNTLASGDATFASSLLSFSPRVFFVALLPPIIYNSGYHLRRELFFRHLLPIALFAVAGTLISALAIAFLLDLVVKLGLTGGFQPTMTELLTFGALISATDPVSTLAVFQAKRVDPHLFYIVFGESVLNDAVGIVLFKAFAKFVVAHNGAGKIITSFGSFIFSFLLDAIGSPILGLLCGSAAALLFKHIDMRTNRLLELSLYILIMYVPFLLAELIHLSGIVTILFTGMAARSFVVPNLSIQTADTAEKLFRLAAHLAETSIFLELGLSVFGLTGSFELKFTLWALAACLVARAVHVYPITMFFNQALQRDPKELMRRAGVACVSNQQYGPPKNISTRSGRKKSKENHVVKFHEDMSNSLATDDHHVHEDKYHEAEGVYHEAPNIMPQESDMSSITPKRERDLKIASKTAHMLWFSGLRGAVAYACVRSFPNTFGHTNEFAMTTMAIVLITIFLLGSTTECMLNFLGIDMDVNEEKYMEEWHKQRSADGTILRLEAFVNKHALRCDDANFMDDQVKHSNTDLSSPRRMESNDIAYYDDHPLILRKESLFDFGGCI